MHSVIQSIRSVAGRALRPLALVLILGAFAGRAWEAVVRSRTTGERGASRRVLPSIYDDHPEATRAPRRSIGVMPVAIDDIVGTMRHPSQNTADFLPLPRLRGENWRARWQRITRAMDRLTVLPPVELVRVGDDYYVADGHNRVAAARRLGAAEIDADVTQLVVPGKTPRVGSQLDAGSLVGSESVRRAAEGRITRTVEQRGSEDLLTRADLLRDEDAEAADVSSAAGPEGGRVP
jgi:hypothetical protein